MGRSPDVVVVGAGVVGAACAYYLAAAGVRVRLYDRSYVASGQLRRLRGQRARLGQGTRARAAAGAALGRPVGRRSPSELDDDFEYDRKGSVVVAETEDELTASRRAQRACSPGSASRARCSTPTRCAARSRTPRTTCPGGVLYPGDAQLEPRLATAALVRAAVALGAELITDVTRRPRSCAAPTAARPASRPAAGRVGADMVVVAAGVWTPELLETAGLTVPVTPRKGQIVVLERSPVVFRRKLSEAGYVAAVEADDAALQIAMVVESTPSRHRAARLQPPARRLRPRRSSSASPARSPAAPPASSRSSTTPARCASTPACGR